MLTHAIFPKVTMESIVVIEKFPGSVVLVLSLPTPLALVTMQLLNTGALQQAMEDLTHKWHYWSVNGLDYTTESDFQNDDLGYSLPSDSYQRSSRSNSRLLQEQGIVSPTADVMAQRYAPGATADRASQNADDVSHASQAYSAAFNAAPSRETVNVHTFAPSHLPSGGAFMHVGTPDSRGAITYASTAMTRAMIGVTAQDEPNSKKRKAK